MNNAIAQNIKKDLDELSAVLTHRRTYGSFRQSFLE